jgi:ATP-dependent DNA helicase Q4
LLLCIDEAHCVSEWSHNFRPAYLRIGAVLAGFEETLPGCADRIQTLCLTATASVQTQDSICKHLGCNPEFTVRTSHSLPQGIEFRVVQCENRKKDLLQLLTKSRFWQEDEQVLIYVNFQADADQFAALLRSEGLEADAYHAGRTPTQRSRVQRLFMSGAMKYVVATVAFGMGIHKSDLRVVVHCGLPRSIEGFVQESGRAGRSQRGGVSVVLLDKNDFPRLQSLCFSKSIDKAVVSRVVSDTARTRGVDNELIADLAEISRKNSVQTSLVETIVSYAHSLCPQLIRAVSYETTVYEVVFRNKSAATLGETWKVASFMRDVKSGRGGRYRLVMAEICKSAGLSHEEACVELEEMNVRFLLCFVAVWVLFHLILVLDCSFLCFSLCGSRLLKSIFDRYHKGSSFQ